MADERVPQYRLPGGQKVPADGAALVGPDYLFWSASNPLPVVQETAVPGIYDLVPFYLDPNGISVPADGVCIVLNDGSIVGPGNPMPTTGGGGGAVAASDVSVTNPGYDNAQEIFDALLYVPLNINSFSGGGTYEIGATVNSVNLAWSYNKTESAQSINQGIGPLALGVRAYPLTGLGLTSNRTWTLSADDGTTFRTAGTTVQFLPKRYWGPWVDAAPDNAEILTLSQELSSGRAKAVTYNCTGGRFPIYVYPTSFGALSGVTVGGLAFSDYSLDTISLTNAEGYVQNYYRFSFNGIQTGAAINVVFS